ncbi:MULTISPECIES: hypothetical protein [Bradyrhizobium]
MLATALSEIDWGFHVILVTDALCSSADETHDATMAVHLNRFGEQVECVKTKRCWLRSPLSHREPVRNASYLSSFAVRPFNNGRRPWVSSPKTSRR